MRAEDSSFPRSSRFLVLLFPLLCLSLTRCTAQSLWGLSADQVLGRLQRGDIEFLRQLPAEELGDAPRLGAGASYCLAQHCTALGLHDQAEALLAQEARRGRGPWRAEAALELGRRLLAQQRYGEAEALAKGGVGHETERLRIEALYWQERDREVLERLQSRRRAGAPWDAELDLFAAVARCRLAEPGWPQGFIDLFLSVKASTLHLRAYGFLLQRDALGSFEPATAALFAAKDLLYRGQAVEALGRLEPLLGQLPPQYFDGTVLLEELGAAYFAAAAAQRGARALMERSDSLAGRARLDCREMAGRLLRRSGDVRARQLLEEVRTQSPDAAQRDRVAWFLLDMARQEGLLAKELERQVPAANWKQPAYFADLLEQEITRLAARRSWGELLRLSELLPPDEPAQVRSRLEFILARVASLGLLAGPQAPAVRPLMEKTRGRGGYYALLAEAWLGAPGAAAVPESPVEEVPDERQIELIRGLLRFGLHLQAADRALTAGIPAGFRLEVAAALRDQGRFAASIRLAAAVGTAHPDAPGLQYPRAYGKQIEAVAARESVDPALLFALVREESLFDASVVSGSGAVGLTQLMEEAAADAARRLGLATYDLRDPDQNLRLGGRHLARLLARLEDVPKTLMAYNAGLSRLRSWESAYAGLPSDLLLEALPFPETQGYVRKILVSAARYDALYFGGSARRTVALFYPLLADGKGSVP